MVLPFSRARQAAIRIALGVLAILVVLPAFGTDVCYAFSNPQDTSITMVWTATGDDGYVGRARRYEMRYSTERIGTDTLAWWNDADTVEGLPDPAWSGTQQSVRIDGLLAGEPYFFIIIAIDNGGNRSPWSVACTNCFMCGDTNADGKVDISDLTFLLGYWFGSGPPPLDPKAADVAGPDGVINIVDVAKLIDYLFSYGSSLDCNNGQD